MSTWSVRSRRRVRQRLLLQRLATGSGDQARGRSGGVPPRAPRAQADERDDLGARLDKLLDAANAASGHARNVYVTFLLFGLYLAIIFGSTTHEQLLRQSPVTLPLLNVGLPLLGFYWIAPALFVLLHLNLLLELYLLSGKLHRFRRALRSAVAHRCLDRQRADERRAQLYPFPFTQMLLGRQHSRLMRFLLWLVVWLTVLVLPVVLLLMGQVRFLPYHDAWTTMWQRFLIAADLLLILIFWRAIRHPGDRLRSHLGRWRWHQAKVALPALVMLAFSFLILTFPGAYSGGANLRDTYLFVASLQGANLAAVDLRGAMLNSADLRGAGFHGADLRGAEVAGANLQGASFEITDLGPANLQGASLSGANLQGALLGGANLQGASLGGASLQGADLEAADLRGASLRGAHLWRTSLGGNHWALADLTGASLDPIADLDVWVERETADIDNEATRSAVKDLLSHALKSNRRSDVPAFPEVWRSSPDIMFDADEPPAVKLGWSAPQWETPEDYDAELALFLGDLGCDQFATTHVGRRFAQSILEPNPFEPSPPLLARLLASRLAGDDCPPAAEWPDDLRRRLEQLAAGSGAGEAEDTRP